MMSKQTYVPAISREVEFIAKNISEADAIYFDDDIYVEELVKDLTEAVYDRANGTVEELLGRLEEEVLCAVKGVVRIEWVNTDRKLYWSSKGRVYNAHGRKKRIGLAGIDLPCYIRNPPRLIGWVYVLGGQDGRRKLVRACDGKIFARVASDHPKEYSNGYSDCVIWFDEKLTLATRRDELRKELGLCAKRFFKVVKRIM